MDDKTQTMGFWRQQFSSRPTLYQTAFDVAAGILLPYLCLVFDPFVFRPVFEGAVTSLFTRFQIFAYVGVALALFTLALWLTLGERVKAWTGFIAGILLTSAAFALGIGVALVPFSLIGLLFFGIGLFGFVPFLTAFVFFRNSFRSLRLANSKINRKMLVSLAGLGILFITVIPFFAQWQTEQIISQSIQNILGDDVGAATRAELRLKYLNKVVPEYVE